MPAKFLVFACGERTGAALFADLLRSHPDVMLDDSLLTSRVRSPRRAAQRMRRRHPRRVVGFPVTAAQLASVQGVDDVGAWLSGMQRRGWRVLAVQRDNLLRQVLSGLIAEATDRYADRSGEGEFVRVRPHVNPDELVRLLGARSAFAAAEAAALAGVPHLGLTYEPDLQDPASWPATMQRVFDYLDLPPAPVATSLRRLNAGRLSSLIANSDDVRATLAATDYARYLD